MSTTPFTLGRHVQHDEASRHYAFSVDKPQYKSTAWSLSEPVLNQGNISSCVGNAFTQLLNLDLYKPFRAKLDKSWFTERDAITLYSKATTFNDPGLGTYPPTDSGSSGLAGAKACVALGYVDTYQHCFDFDALCAAVQTQPVCVGTAWTDQMFTPDGNNFVSPGPLSDSTIVGGHEYLCRGVNFELQFFTFLNSWGSGWGQKGSFFITFDDVKALLAADGDAVVPHVVGS